MNRKHGALFSLVMPSRDWRKTASCDKCPAGKFPTLLNNSNTKASRYPFLHSFPKPYAANFPMNFEDCSCPESPAAHSRFALPAPASTLYAPIRLKRCCQVDGCKNPFPPDKSYHNRFKICKEHSVAAEVTVNCQLSRFCWQCRRFQPLVEFDGLKRSCRTMLARHNARRKKAPLASSTLSSSRGSPRLSGSLPSSPVAPAAPLSSAGTAFFLPNQGTIVPDHTLPSVPYYARTLSPESYFSAGSILPLQNQTELLAPSLHGSALMLTALKPEPQTVFMPHQAHVPTAARYENFNNCCGGNAVELDADTLTSIDLDELFDEIEESTLAQQAAVWHPAPPPAPLPQMVPTWDPRNGSGSGIFLAPNNVAPQFYLDINSTQPLGGLPQAGLALCGSFPTAAAWPALPSGAMPCSSFY